MQLVRPWPINDQWLLPELLSLASWQAPSSSRISTIKPISHILNLCIIHSIVYWLDSLHSDNVLTRMPSADRLHVIWRSDFHERHTAQAAERSAGVVSNLQPDTQHSQALFRSSQHWTCSQNLEHAQRANSCGTRRFVIQKCDLRLSLRTGDWPDESLDSSGRHQLSIQ